MKKTMSKELKSGSDIKVYGYRWIVLIAFMLLNIVIQLQWLAHASIARIATAFFEANGTVFSDFYNVDWLAMLYMVFFLIACIPASYVIDKFGIQVGVGFGSILTVVATLFKGIFAANFLIVFIAQIILAIAQPFIINAYTALAMKWFPLKERGTAVGLASLSQYLGFIIAMIVTPLLVGANGEGLETTMLVYGIISAVVGIGSVLLIKEKPPTPPAHDTVEKLNFLNGIKHMFSKKDMIIVIILFFIGLGIFNAISSMTDAINNYLGVEDSDGLIGGLMIIGGIIGAVVIPIMSDMMKKRKIFLIICIIGMAVGIIGITCSKYVNTNKYEWTITNIVPEGSELKLVDKTHGIQLIKPDKEGLYEFSLKVTKKGEIIDKKNVYVLAATEKPDSYVIGGDETNIVRSMPDDPTKKVDGEKYFVYSTLTIGKIGAKNEGKTYYAPVYLENTIKDDNTVATVYILALISAFVLGFSVMSAGPIGFQYAAEVTFPTPEASSQGVLLLAGQITGLGFTQLMSIKNNSYLPIAMIIFSIAAIIGIFLVTLIKESPMIITEQDKAEGNLLPKN